MTGAEIWEEMKHLRKQVKDLHWQNRKLEERVRALVAELQKKQEDEDEEPVAFSDEGLAVYQKCMIDGTKDELESQVQKYTETLKEIDEKILWKKGKYWIKTIDQEGREESHQVEGVTSGIWGIHEVEYNAIDNPEYSLTHIPSGYSAFSGIPERWCKSMVLMMHIFAPELLVCESVSNICKKGKEIAELRNMAIHARL